MDSVAVSHSHWAREVLWYSRRRGSTSPSVQSTSSSGSYSAGNSGSGAASAGGAGIDSVAVLHSPSTREVLWCSRCRGGAGVCDGGSGVVGKGRWFFPRILASTMLKV